jgi:cytochrome c556
MLAGCQDHEQHGASSAQSPSAHAAEHDAHHEATASAQPSAVLNPVQNEMQLLTTALEGAVRGIGLGDVRAVEHDLHRVHLAKEATGAALQSGSYKPPKNPDQLERFRALDEAFHGDLERLVDASHRNDVPGTAAALGTVMQACQGCHSEFRR